jgi:hypothetical protein
VPAHDPFFPDSDVLQAVGDAFHAGTRVDLPGWSPAAAKNAPFGLDEVYSIVLEVPDAELLAVAPDGRINSWALTVLATDAGDWHPIDRAGLPMIHPPFAQHDGRLGNQLNAAAPAEDRKLFGDRFARAIAKVVSAYGTVADPETYGRAVADKLLPNVLPYTVGTQAIFGYGLWNGRLLTDSAPDVMFPWPPTRPCPPRSPLSHPATLQLAGAWGVSGPTCGGPGGIRAARSWWASPVGVRGHWLPAQ